MRLTGPAKDWLEAQREQLNARFLMARRRHPRLDGDLVLDLLAEFLPFAAGQGEPGSGELMQSVYDLALLHAGRGLLGRGGNGAASSPVEVLLRETLPALRPFLLQRPESLPGALSNAVENLEERGAEFARALPDVAAALKAPDELLAAGALLAWRLGEARLREEALACARKLPDAAVRAALRLEGWPAAAAPLALAGLEADAWLAPETQFARATLERMNELSGSKRRDLERQLAAPPPRKTDRWVCAGSAGNFRGFGGRFDEPPLLLDAGVDGGRHTFWVLSTEGVFRLDADVYGSVCRPATGVDLPVHAVAERTGRLAKFFKGEASRPTLFADGSLEGGGIEGRIEAAQGASSFAHAPGLLAFTRPDSFRVRFMVPERTPL